MQPQLKKVSLLMRSHSRVQDVFTGEVTRKSISYLHRIGSLQVLHQHVLAGEGDSEPEGRVGMVGV